jgi:2'-5' RNA ligase
LQQILDLLKKLVYLYCIGLKLLYMNSLHHPFEGQHFFEYLLILSPNAPVSAEITKVKMLFSEQYGCKDAAKSKPHLTLAKFFHFESNEFRLINCFEKQAKFIQPFSVLLDGYDHFGEHTIFVNVTDKVAVIALVKELKSKFRRIMTCTASLKPFFMGRPHVTIAKRLNEPQYQEAWPALEKQSFTSSFIAEEMVLLKRPVDSQTLAAIGPYKPIQYFSFRGKSRDEQLFFGFASPE